MMLTSFDPLTGGLRQVLELQGQAGVRGRRQAEPRVRHLLQLPGEEGQHRHLAPDARQSAGGAQPRRATGQGQRGRRARR